MNSPIEIKRCHDVVAQQQPCNPLCCLQRHDRNLDEGLHHTSAKRNRLDDALLHLVWRLQRNASVGGDCLDTFGEFLQTRVIVKITHRSGGNLCTYPANQSRSRERGTAKGEEVGVFAAHRSAEDIDPFLSNPGFRCAEVISFHHGARKRPRQRLLINLAGGGDRQIIHHVNARNQSSRHGFGESGSRDVVIKSSCSIFQRNVCNQNFLIRTSGLNNHCGGTNVGKRCHIGINFTELDASTADFHLIINAAHKVEAIFFQTNVVTGTISAGPTNRLQWRILLAVFFWIKVACKTHTTDDQFADLADSDRFAGIVDNNKIPTSKWQTNAHWLTSIELSTAGNHRCFGRAVGVPHLAVRRR